MYRRIELFGVVFLFAIFSLGCQLKKDSSMTSYTIETMALPPGLGGQVGALDFLTDGKLVACFSSGEVMFYDVNKKEWSVFGRGLHEPLGVMAVSTDTVLVMQKPELTRIIDLDGDGEADKYETMADGFGLSGNFHEFAYGPVRDKSGNLYIALNSSSATGGMMNEVRGEINPLTEDHPKQMFSTVPYRGWIMQYTKDGKLIPYAYGLRSPNGLLVDRNDNFFSTDNQGDWVPTSSLFLIKKGKFYGHPASMVWTEGWSKGNPYKLDEAYLDSIREKPIVLFPQGIMASSPSEPVIDYTEGKFGPFQGQIFVGEMNISRIVRVMLDTIGNKVQGACTPFIDDEGLRKGNNRLAFDADGNLWVGQNDHGWGGDRGIQKISYTGNVPLDVLNMKLTKEGFGLNFTLPLEADSLKVGSHFQMRHYRYHYSHNYGSDLFDETPDEIQSIALSEDGKTVSIQLDSLQKDMIYELTMNNLVSESGVRIEDKIICYTLNSLMD